MSLARQGKLFLLMGFLQWIADWLVTVALSYAGLPLELANLCGRVVGALLGFGLNGKITFATEGHKLGRAHFLRFIVFWLVLTFVSTWAVGGIGRHFGLQAAWLAKPLIEILLAVVSFFVSRQWIYR